MPTFTRWTVNICFKLNYTVILYLLLLLQRFIYLNNIKNYLLYYDTILFFNDLKFLTTIFFTPKGVLVYNTYIIISVISPLKYNYTNASTKLFN